MRARHDAGHQGEGACTKIEDDADATACKHSLLTAHNRGILTVFLTYIGPCALAPVAMFVLVTCSSGSTAPTQPFPFVIVLQALPPCYS